ncbi:MAG TPA: isoamylase early set domain-containing protein [Gemmatimonadaceae bacterium]|nr:isoamylase early set domain-containing protein [Gemmatimonadaceae bacterium]
MSFCDHWLEGWLTRELERPVELDPNAKKRVMDRIRASGPRERSSRQPRPSGARRPPTFYSSPLIGAVLAAGFAAAIVAGPIQSGRDGGRAEPTMRAGLADTVSGAIEDTLRFVRFFLEAPAARRVALVGDFNRWDPRATPLAEEGARGAWSATVPLGRGRHQYAFVVDDTQWLADPAAAPGAERAGRRTSVVDLVAIPHN